MVSDAQPRILVVDDDEQLLELYEERINAIGDFSVSTAASGQVAIDQLDDTLDLVVLDLNIPVRSGAEVLEAIEDCEAEIPTVVISGQEHRDATGHRGEEFLKKPIHLEQLERVLGTYLD